jgi:predicted DNA-binding transcriptional regulator YafY
VPQLADAVWNERRIRVRYESWKDLVDRELEPLGLVLKGGLWYLVARAGGKTRTYRVSNIHKLEVTSEQFTYPQRFDLAGYWDEWSKEFEARLYQGTATLRLSPLGVQRLRLLAPAVTEMAARTAGKPDKQGWVRVEIPVENTNHAITDILRLGADAEVLGPPELKKKVVENAAALSALYAKDITPPPARAKNRRRG